MEFRAHTFLHGLHIMRTSFGKWLGSGYSIQASKLKANKKLLIFENFQLKFVFSKKATNIDENIPLLFTLTT